MKTAILFVFLTFTLRVSHAQFTLEHSFPIGSTTSDENQQLYMVNFEVEGHQYILIDRSVNTIYIYDLNYSLVKTIIPPISVLDYANYSNESILYFSEHLFNNDDKIEFMVCKSFKKGSPPTTDYNTYIVNEDGVILFSKAKQVPTVVPNYHQQQYPIYNTPNGTKMILSSTTSDSSFVYSLPGTFTTFIKKMNNNTEEQSSEIYPNPSFSESNIEFRIEEDDVPATLKIFDVSGKEYTSYNLDSKEGKISFETLNLPAGNYFYSIQNQKKILSNKKFIVVH